MDAQSGVPTAFAPLQLDADAEILRLENAARSGLQPRIFGFAAHAVPIAAGGSALVFRVPRSYNQPHRIVRQGSGASASPMSTSFGRCSYARPGSRSEFAIFASIGLRRSSPATCRSSSWATIPSSCMSRRLRHSRAGKTFQLKMDEHPQHLVSAFPPIGTEVGQVRINMDGCLVLSNLGSDGRSHRAYVQIYRSGIVEAVDSRLVMGEGTGESPFRLTSIRMKARSWRCRTTT
ncbi:hypothetical protein [Bradyrhizobium pachyrhizi]|uniref:hypothetical protein n=1 Tax=Bradyrhizobium pachyrhizi TaxID=280333 RepID=UPI000AF2273F|nr:hypothetical protein [Bradyrhizobium pachyrhizi]